MRIEINCELHALLMILRLRDMLRGRAGGKDTLVKWLIHVLSSIVLRVFFRRIEVIGAELVPRSGGVLFVLNHPSGLIDPAVVFCVLPRHAMFLLHEHIHESLYAVTLNVETSEALKDVRKAERLFSSIYETITIRESLAKRFERLRQFAEAWQSDEPEIDERGALQRRINEYETGLKTLGLRPAHLSITRHSHKVVFRHVILKP